MLVTEFSCLDFSWDEIFKQYWLFGECFKIALYSCSIFDIFPDAFNNYDSYNLSEKSGKMLILKFCKINNTFVANE